MTGCYGQSPFKRLILVAIILLLGGCTSAPLAGAPPTIKIGLVAPVEGLHRPLGYEALFGIKLAVQQRNVGQGLNGYRVEVIVLNDFDDPEEAIIQARALVADPDVVGVVGHLSSATSLAALPIYQQAELAVTIPWTIEATGLSADHTGVVSVAATEAETSAQLATVSKRMGLNNLIELEDEEVPLMPDRVEALELTADAITSAELLVALTESNVSLPMLGHVDVGSPQLVQVADSAAEGLIFVSPGPDPGDLTGTEGFSEAYQILAGFPPGPRAVLAYDATNVLLDAIEQTIEQHGQHPGRAEVSRSIRQVERAGLSGSIAFDDQGRRIDAPVWVYQISERRYPGNLISSPE